MDGANNPFLPSLGVVPATFLGRTVAKHKLELFTPQIDNDRARTAWLNATRYFAKWCASQRLKQHLAA
jgi:hypothetical protein